MLLPSKRMREKNTGENVKRIVGNRNVMWWMSEKLEKAQKRFARKGIPQAKWVSSSSLQSLCPKGCVTWNLTKRFRKQKKGIHRAKSSCFVQEPPLALLNGFTSISIHLSIKSQNLPKENLFFSSFP